MVFAFVLINTIGKTSDTLTLEKLKEIPEVREAYAVFGSFDIIARIDAKKNPEGIREVTSRIRKIETVRSTCTLIIY